MLKVDRTGLTPLPLGASSGLEVGDQLVAIGNALDLSGGPTVTTGIVSATGRSLSEENGVTLTDMIQTDTAINPGNSGGPLFNMAGQVVGINTAVAGQAQNIGFAISIDHAKSLIEQLQQGDVPAHALLGVGTQPSQDGKGVEVAQVDPGSAADKAGLQQGDVITKVDGTVIDGPDTLGGVIAGHKPGDQVSVTYTRDGASHDGHGHARSLPDGQLIARRRGSERGEPDGVGGVVRLTLACRARSVSPHRSSTTCAVTTGSAGSVIRRPWAARLPAGRVQGQQPAGPSRSTSRGLERLAGRAPHGDPAPRAGALVPARRTWCRTAGTADPPAVDPVVVERQLAAGGVLRAAGGVGADHRGAEAEQAGEAVDRADRLLRGHPDDERQLDGVDVAEAGDDALVEQGAGQRLVGGLA